MVKIIWKSLHYSISTNTKHQKKKKKKMAQSREQAAPPAEVSEVGALAVPEREGLSSTRTAFPPR